MNKKQICGGNETLKRLIIAVMFVASLALTGCEQAYNISDDDLDKMAQYVADLMVEQYKISKGIVKVDKSGNKKTNYEVPAKPSATLPQQPDNVTDDVGNNVGGDSGPNGNAQSTGNNQNVGSNQNTNNNQNSTGNANDNAFAVVDSLAAITTALEIEGVEIEYIGYCVEERYPTDSFALTVEPSAGHKLLVVQYNVWNSENEKKTMSVNPKGVGIKAIVNGNENINVYKTLLNTDLMNMNGSKFEAGETKTGVLIFNISTELADNITSVDVSATRKPVS